MSARSTTTGFELRAVYRIPELARLAGISRWRMRRLLEEGGVELSRSGRMRLVYLADVQRALPVLWESLMQRALAGPGALM
jgi:hypothetical protein